MERLKCGNEKIKEYAAMRLELEVTNLLDKWEGVDISCERGELDEPFE